MVNILIRKVDEQVKARLRLRAARHGRSMEAEARELLERGLAAERPGGLNLADAIRRRIAAVGGVELSLPPREPARRPPRLGR
ncbi:MAG: plasmid stabilization protein [Bryobacteraceae bacterium]